MAVSEDGGTVVVAPVEFGDLSDVDLQTAVLAAERERFPLLTLSEPEEKEEVVVEPDLPLEGDPPGETELERTARIRAERRYSRRAREERTRVGTVSTYVAGPRGLTIGGEYREPGVEVPEALTWPRVETWVAAGRIVPVPA